MPAFAKGQKGEEEIVSAPFPGFEPSGTEKVGDGIDGKGGVVEGDGRDEETPDQGRHPGESGPLAEPGGLAEYVAGGSEDHHGNPVEPVEEKQFPELCEVAYLLHEGGNGIIGHKPERMAPEETFGVRGMIVFLGIGMAVVPSVVGSPPQRSPLARGASHEGTKKLDQPARLEGTVGEIAMVEGGDGKHPHCVRQNSDQDTGE